MTVWILNDWLSMMHVRTTGCRWPVNMTGCAWFASVCFRASAGSVRRGASPRFPKERPGVSAYFFPPGAAERVRARKRSDYCCVGRGEDEAEVSNRGRMSDTKRKPFPSDALGVMLFYSPRIIGCLEVHTFNAGNYLGSLGRFSRPARNTLFPPLTRERSSVWSRSSTVVTRGIPLQGRPAKVIVLFSLPGMIRI